MEFIKRNTDYALRALVYMAETGGERPHSMGEIASATGTPETFLRKVVQKLDAAGMVATKRGAGGGVSLSRLPETISVFDVVEAVQGPVAINKCFMENRECIDLESCHIRRTLGKMQNDIVVLFKTATVAKLTEHSKPLSGRSV